MKYYSYNNFKDDVNSLVSQVVEFEAEAIVAIARGGLTLSHALAEGLDIRDVQSIRTEFYDVQMKRDEIAIFGDCNFENIKRVLVVDDISDSGETLSVVMEYLKSGFKGIEFKSVTLFYKETSKCEPDFWINIADDWIDFFWQRDFVVMPS